MKMRLVYRFGNQTLGLNDLIEDFERVLIDSLIMIHLIIESNCKTSRNSDWFTRLFSIFFFMFHNNPITTMSKFNNINVKQL